MLRANAALVTVVKMNLNNKATIITATGGVSIDRQLRHPFIEYKMVNMSVFYELKVRDKIEK